MYARCVGNEQIVMVERYTLHPQLHSQKCMHQDITIAAIHMAAKLKSPK